MFMIWCCYHNGCFISFNVESINVRKASLFVVYMALKIKLEFKSNRVGTTIQEMQGGCYAPKDTRNLRFPIDSMRLGTTVVISATASLEKTMTREHASSFCKLFVQNNKHEINHAA